MDLNKIVDQAIAKYPDKVIQYKNGKRGLIGLFVGESMKLLKSNDSKISPRIMMIVQEKLNNIK